MGKKKVRVTNELLERAERVLNGGEGSLTRGECRALFRRGYLERKLSKGDDGSMRYGYKLASAMFLGPSERVR